MRTSFSNRRCCSATRFVLARLILTICLAAASGNCFAQLSDVSNAAEPGPTLASAIHGVYDTPPSSHPTGHLPSGAVLGNGDLGLTVEGPANELKFYIGKSDFWGVQRGAIVSVGSDTLTIPALAQSSYHLSENIGPANLTGHFQAPDGHALDVTSWVAAGQNLGVTVLTNSGTAPLTISSSLSDNFGTAGNPATAGATADETWLRSSPDNTPVVAGSFAGAAFVGKIAGLRVDSGALTPSEISNLDSGSAPAALLPWNPNAPGTPPSAVVAGDPHGGSVVFSGDPKQSLDLGVMCLPQTGFTVSGWVQLGATVPDSPIFAAVSANNPKSYPFFRGLILGVSGGKLTATLYNTTVIAPSPLPSGQWVQVAVVYSVASLSLVINGQTVASSSNFPTASDQMGFDKMAIHLGDKDVPYSGCAPRGIVRQRVVGPVATASAPGTLTFTIAPGGSATLLLAVVTDRNRPDYLTASDSLVHSTPDDLAHLTRLHLEWWNAFWSRSYIEIPDQVIQANWYGSLYLLACCSSPNCPPPGLWGNFVTGHNMAWEGDYTLDYNYQAPFWAAYCTNHHELAENYDGVLLSQMPRGYAIAKYASLLDENRFPESAAAMPNASQLATAPAIRNFKGIFYYCHLIPLPGWSDDYGTFWGQKSDALFAAVDMVQRWRYTHDLVYAKKIYPFLLGVSEFWDNYLVLQNGAYVSLDDSVSEGSGANTNPATTLSFLRLMYPSLIEISELLNADADRRPKWLDIMKRLSPFKIVPAASLPSLAHLNPASIANRNVIRDSDVGPEFPRPMIDVYQDHQQRGSSAGMNQTQAIFPGWSFGLESSASDLKAALDTVTIAAEWYDFNDDCTFYPAAANVGYDPTEILQNLDSLLQTSQNPSFIIQTGGGGTEDFAIVPVTIASMFLQSYQSSIHVFPNWPASQNASFGNLNACGGFLISSSIKGGNIQFVKIKSNAGQVCKLTNPWPGKMLIVAIDGKTQANITASLLTISTRAGEEILLKPKPLITFSVDRGAIR